MRPTIVCQVRLSTSRPIKNVSLSLQCPLGITSSVNHLTFARIESSDHMQTNIKLDSSCLPSGLDVQLSVCYQNNDQTGKTKVHCQQIRLPLTLVAKPCDTPKKMKHRFTIESSRPCADLTRLLPSMTSSENSSNCVGMQYIHGPKATILTSKSSNKYRIESEELPCMWLLIIHCDVTLRCNDKINLNELFTLIDRHVEVRKA